MSDSDRNIIFQILSHLAALKGGLSEADSENLDVACGMIESIFNVSAAAPDDFTQFSYYPMTLPTIFDEGISSLKAQSYSEAAAVAESNPNFQRFVEMVTGKGFYEGTEEGSVEYMQRHAKLLQKFGEKMNPNVAEQRQKEENEKAAEEKKVQGNTAMSAKDYTGAIHYYTEAIELSQTGPNSHIYYSNRAAAYCHVQDYGEAVADCEESIKLSPDYVKAISRLGLANFFLENFDASVKAYERAVELEPDNEVIYI